MNYNQMNFSDAEAMRPASASKNAAYYRERARMMLKGNWGNAILVCFLALILGGVISGGFTYSFSIDLEDHVDTTYVPYGTLFETADLIPWVISTMISIVLFVGTVSIAISLFVSSPIKLGYQKLNLDLVDGKPMAVSGLFSYFRLAYWRSIGLNALYTLIASVIVIVPAVLLSIVVIGLSFSLLVPPGGQYSIQDYINILSSYMPLLAISGLLSVVGNIVSMILHYMYRFAYTVMAEYPQMGAVEALRVSRNMMKGHKWQFFCLDLSFIGWYLLASLFTFGIGFIVLYPYREAAFAALYDDLSNRGAAKETVFPSLDPDDYTLEGDMADYDATAPDPEPAPENVTEETSVEEEQGAQETEERGAASFDASAFASTMEFPSLDLNDYSDDDDGLFHRSFQKKQDKDETL